jgi:hypothetical protein
MGALFYLIMLSVARRRVSLIKYYKTIIEAIMWQQVSDALTRMGKGNTFHGFNN